MVSLDKKFLSEDKDGPQVLGFSSRGSQENQMGSLPKDVQSQPYSDRAGVQYSSQGAGSLDSNRLKKILSNEVPQRNLMNNASEHLSPEALFRTNSKQTILKREKVGDVITPPQDPDTHMLNDYSKNGGKAKYSTVAGMKEK